MARQRIGIVGCGSVARWHVGNLLALDEVEIVGLVDPSATNLAAMRRAHPPLASVPAFAGAEEFYEAIPLDAVELNTPHTLHHAQVLAALDRGLHVLCEKPLAVDSAAAREIAARAAATDRTVMVAYQRRCDPAYRFMRRAIESGELGEIRAIAVVCGQNWQPLTVGSWRQDPALSGGGMLMDSGSHLVDALLWLVGRPPVAVAATVDALGSPVDINATATVRFDGGAQGQLTVIGDLPATWIESVLITGSAGVLRYETEPQHPWRTGRLFQYRDGAIAQPLDLPAAPTVDAAWLAAIAGRAPNPAPPEVGVWVAELTEAIYASAREGRVVDLAAPAELTPLAAAS